FQVMVTLQTAERARNADMRATDELRQPYPLESGISKFDLSIDFVETQAGLQGSIEYSTALYKRETIERMAGHFVALCRAITMTATGKISDLEYLGEKEKQKLLVDFNNTRAGYSRDKCIHEIFAEQVAIHPAKAAVVFGDEDLSYGDLYEKSGDLALYLQSMGVKPDSL